MPLCSVVRPLLFATLLTGLAACTEPAALTTNGEVRDFVLPTPNSGPTTLAIAPADVGYPCTLSSSCDSISSISDDTPPAAVM